MVKVISRLSPAMVCRAWQNPGALLLRKVMAAFIALALLWRVQGAVRGALAGKALPGASEGAVHGSTSLRHAERFTVEYRPDCKIVRVSDSRSGPASWATYQLVPRGHRPASVEKGATLVETPARRAIALSSVYAPAFLRLGVPEILVGIAGVKLLNTPELVAQAEKGRLSEVGDGSLSMNRKLDLERIRELSPDLIMVSFQGGENAKLREAGFTVVENSEWLESSPLGRAEWIKFLAAFIDREVEADRIFSEVEQRYETQRARALSVAHKPTVLCGLDQRGTWYVPGGRSYVAAYLRDAGGDYLWKENPGQGGQPMKIESVLDRARAAEIWLLHTTSVHSRQEIAELDPRHALFQPLRTGRVYNNDARVSPGGGNDYWETAVSRPDLVLGDLIAILHPELAPDHLFNWYRQLPEETKP